mgnify:CR=1 FL=1
MKNYFKIITSIIFLILSSNCFSDENLNYKIYKNLRCLVCQGQTIADSNSDFAMTIKSVVDDKVKDGMKENEIYNFLADKYGDWILYKPPFKLKNYILWFLPYILFFLGGVLLLLIFLKKTPLSKK